MVLDASGWFVGEVWTADSSRLKPPREAFDDAKARPNWVARGGAVSGSTWTARRAPAMAASLAAFLKGFSTVVSFPPETPKVAASSEIQLHLKANDQTSASIRVTDRAGAVNISVHASDAQVRNSLRSNLSDLSAQLNTQGWKTEVVKTASVVNRTDSGQETPPGGRHSFSQQQHSANTERQPDRNRHPNSGQWQDEFEEQITGNDANRGGKN